MNPEDATAHFARILAIEADKFSAKLAEKEIVLGAPEIEILNANPLRFSSEIRLYFYKNGEIVDVFEFFVYRDGIKFVTEESLRQWAQDELEKILAENFLADNSGLS